MRSYVGTFAMRTGTGTQTVAVPFEAKALMFFGLGTLDTLMYGDGGFRDAFMVSTGQDDGTIHLGNASSDAAGFGVKFVVGGSSGTYSIIADHTQAAFGGYITVKASVTSITSTGFTLTYDLNDTSSSSVYPYFVAGQSFMFVALGGDDLDVSMGIPNAGTPTTAGFELAGLISRRQILGSGTSTGTGSGDTGQIGWMTADGDQGCVASFTVNQGPLYSYLATDRVTCALTDAGTVTSGQVSNITATAFTANAAYSGSYLAVGGTDVVTSTGVFTQSATAGSQTIDVGINASVVLFATVGTTDAERGVVQTGEFQLVYGALTASSLASVWCGNTGNNPAAPLGGRYVSDSSLLRFGTPNGASTTFSSVVDSATINADGSVELHWASSDGGDREVIWFAIGEAVQRTPSYTTVPLVERRLRQAPHLVTELQRQFISKFQIHLQPGIGQGTGQGSDPMVMFAYSKDGGHTWSNERLLPAGKVGQFARRCIAWRLGSGRDWVFRVSVTDPNVPWALVAAYLDGGEGTS